MSPWDFIKWRSGEYVVWHVWPVVSRLLLDSDATMRARCLEYVSSLAPLRARGVLSATWSNFGDCRPRTEKRCSA